MDKKEQRRAERKAHKVAIIASVRADPASVTISRFLELDADYGRNAVAEKCRVLGINTVADVVLRWEEIRKISLDENDDRLPKYLWSRIEAGLLRVGYKFETKITLVRDE